MFATLDADVLQIVRWRSGELDRLLDEGHASIVGRMVEYLVGRGWQVEVSLVRGLRRPRFRGSAGVASVDRDSARRRGEDGHHVGRRDHPKARCEVAPGSDTREGAIRFATSPGRPAARAARDDHRPVASRSARSGLLPRLSDAWLRTAILAAQAGHRRGRPAIRTRNAPSGWCAQPDRSKTRRGDSSTLGPQFDEQGELAG
jgi:hypothetical protein